MVAEGRLRRQAAPNIAPAEPLLHRAFCVELSLHLVNQLSRDLLVLGWRNW